MVGRVIVGQIHAPQDEPCKIYYRLLPGHTRGSVYWSYEPEDGGDVYYELIGSRDSDAPEPADGIEIGERWSYEIYNQNSGGEQDDGVRATFFALTQEHDRP